MKKLLGFIAALVLVSGPALVLAADWNFYGSVRVSTFRSNFDNNPFAVSGGVMTGTGTDTDNYEQSLYGLSRIGAKVKVSEALSGRFEYGALGGQANLRILWGEWDFGAGKLGIGQNYTPLIFPYSRQVYSLDALNKGDHSLSTFGMLYGARRPMIQLKAGGLEMAAVQPKALVAVPLTLMAAGQPATEVKIPNFQANYKIDFSSGHIALAAGFQDFKIKSGNAEHRVRSYLLGAGGQLDITPDVYIKASLYGGQNVGNLVDFLVNGALWSTLANAGTDRFDGDGFGLARWDGTRVLDRDALAGLLVAGYTVRKGIYLEAGYGYVRSELDSPGFTKDDAESYYLQATIFLNEGVFFVPEIGRVDMKQSGQPDIRYIGIKWQIDF